MKYPKKTKLRVNKNYNHRHGFVGSEFIYVRKCKNYRESYALYWEGTWHDDGWDSNYIEDPKCFIEIKSWKERLVK